MKITIFGSTGSLGSQCLQQALDANHAITVLVRNAAKLTDEVSARMTVIEGNALAYEAVNKAIPAGTQAILFAIGVDKNSPADLCTQVTRVILQVMREKKVPRLVWCGGGSTLTTDDVLTRGAKFVRWVSEKFMTVRHFDKEHQYALLQQTRDLTWLGVRPLQMLPGPRKGVYRLGYDSFSGFSKISFADCADAMIRMLHDDTWVGKVPIIQY